MLSDDRFCSQVQKLHKRLEELMDSTRYTISKMLASVSSQHDVEGVYVITTPDDRSVVYVGRTKTKSIRGRMNDHLKNTGSSDLNVMLKEYPDYPQDPSKYCVRYISIEQPQQRNYFEHFAIGILEPPFNKK